LWKYKLNQKLPIRHLSVRVPWHDNLWNGTVCKNPTNNASCTFLQRISVAKNEESEEKCAGLLISDLDESEYPICVEESGAFMSPKEIRVKKIHPYSGNNNSDYKHFLPTDFRIPPYSFAAIPFRWMMKEKDHLSKIAQFYDLDYDPNIEPDLGFYTNWVQDHQNQRILLDTFFSAIIPEKSLCFIYAKHIPLSDTSDRILIGVGRVKNTGKAIEYDYSENKERRSIIWDRIIQHSIREDFSDGFLLPYYELLEKYQENPSFNIESVIAVAPNRDEFSYATEHVSNDTAIDSILILAESLKKASTILGKSYIKQLDWINDRLSELWKMRGAFPGIGQVLTAFGVDCGNFIAWEISKIIQEQGLDPFEVDTWEIVEKIFKDPLSILPKDLAIKIGSILKETWHTLGQERKKFLKLLSRFELTNEQADRFCDDNRRTQNNIVGTDKDIIENPYLIYELDRFSVNPIRFRTIDKGVFPNKIIQDKFPLPEPSLVSESVDYRRVQALIINILEEASNEGHSLLPSSFIIQKINEIVIDPPCSVTTDIMNVIEKKIENQIIIDISGKEKTYQLKRLHKIKHLINNFVSKRVAGKRHNISENWEDLLNKKLGGITNGEDNDEILARKEKISALEELANSRFSVLIGSAGTGKTTLLSVLCNNPEIKKGEILALAPTGKARVRMTQSIGTSSQTVAQFLYQYNRFDDKTARYHKLGALIDALQGVQRCILVGDPRQLPPIGTGRPFIDIINYLKSFNSKDFESIFPKIGKGYAELIIKRRQITDLEEGLIDIKLADWFGDGFIPPGEDDVFDILSSDLSLQRIEFIKWQDEKELKRKLLAQLVKELLLKDESDSINFNISLGGKKSGEYVYFNNGNAEKQIEDWQILSPIKGFSYGVKELNRLIHSIFKKDTIEYALKPYKFIPPPMGSDNIVYGDKIINTINHRRYNVYPNDDALKYIANGEIGVVTGLFKRNWSGNRPLNVSFSSQPGFSYTFYNRDFSEEKGSYLELAYAITVHKSQGSEFKLVFLILPEFCPIMSRELLYTAFTRQTERIIIFYQGDLQDLKKFSSIEYSETSRRITNLFESPKLITYENNFYEENLIHRTLKGEFVRSKSEVIVANLLKSKNIDYAYEKKLIGSDGSIRYPDFTIEDDDTGITYYWEHLGMLKLENYRKNWKKKLEWYRKQGILPIEEGGGENGVLLWSIDSEKGGIDSKEIEDLIIQISS